MMALWAVSAVSNAWNVVHWRAMLIEFETKGSHVKEKMYEFSGRRQFSVECISICTDSLSWKIRKKTTNASAWHEMGLRSFRESRYSAAHIHFVLLQISNLFSVFESTRFLAVAGV